MPERTATLAGCLALAAVAVALLVAPSDAAACPAKAKCTDENGTYDLTVPPLPTTGFLAPYRDCVWQVHVDFGDGSDGDYVFDGEVGISGSHTFPSYGEYMVKVVLSGGYHKSSPTHEACPDYKEEVRVLYRDPAKVVEEEELEAKEKEQKEKEAKENGPPAEKPNEKPGGAGPGGSHSGEAGAAEEGREKKGTSHPILVWRNCRGNVYAHLVACTKAQKVIKGAQEKLPARRSAKVAGFRCHLTDDLRPISCRRGRSRVLGPLG